MNALNITKHSIDRTALIAGIMFTFAGLAYLVDDHGIINVTEGAVAGTIVIVIGLVLLLAAVIDSPDVPVATVDDFDATPSTDAGMSTTDQADFSWSSPSSAGLAGDRAEATDVGASADSVDATTSAPVSATEPTDELFAIDEAE